MNIFNKLGDFLVIGGEAAVALTKAQTKLTVFGAELAQDLMVELMESDLGSKVDEVKGPLIKAVAEYAQAKREASVSWKELKKGLMKELGGKPRNRKRRNRRKPWKPFGSTGGEKLAN